MYIFDFFLCTSPVDGLKEFMGDEDDRDAFLATDEGKLAKKATPFFRLWCIVELVAAIVLNVPIVVKGVFMADLFC